MSDPRQEFTEVQKIVAAALRDYQLRINVAAVRSSPHYEPDYDEPVLRERAESATLDWEQAEAVVTAIWPTIEGLLAAATTEGRRQALAEMSDPVFAVAPQSSRVVRGHIARGGSAGQEHPQP